MKASIIFLTLAATVSTVSAGEEDYIPSSDIVKPFDYGMAHSKNFSVLAPPGKFHAEKLLVKAEYYRRIIAVKWIGKQLPEGANEARLHWKESATRDEGTLSPATPKPYPSIAFIWLVTSEERAFSTTLAHEISHVVILERFNNDAPPWVLEGIASTYDDKERKEIREKSFRKLLESGEIPLTEIAKKKSIRPNDIESYCLAEKMVEFLVHKTGGNAKFLAFVDTVKNDGWESALKSIGYDTAGVLEEDFQKHYLARRSRMKQGKVRTHTEGQFAFH